jgi:hypothetical protein
MRPSFPRPAVEAERRYPTPQHVLTRGVPKAVQRRRAVRRASEASRVGRVRLSSTGTGGQGQRHQRRRDYLAFYGVSSSYLYWGQ